jgi:hypothetical protein
MHLHSISTAPQALTLHSQCSVMKLALGLHFIPDLGTRALHQAAVPTKGPNTIFTPVNRPRFRFQGPVSMRSYGTSVFGGEGTGSVLRS